MATGATTDENRIARLRLGAALAIALVAGFLVWLVFIRDDDSSGGGGPNSSAVTVSELQNLAVEVDHPVYWAGPRRATTYELTRTTRGDVFIRYLPRGVPVGDKRPNYLTVGTYPFKGAYATLRQSADREGTKNGTLANRGIYVVGPERPNSVYVAFRGEDVQIEVFAPSARRARELVSSGRLRPLG
jgi:hypothetical protein